MRNSFNFLLIALICMDSCVLIGSILESIRKSFMLVTGMVKTTICIAIIKQKKTFDFLTWDYQAYTYPAAKPQIKFKLAILCNFGALTNITIYSNALQIFGNWPYLVAGDRPPQQAVPILPLSRAFNCRHCIRLHDRRLVAYLFGTLPCQGQA